MDYAACWMIYQRHKRKEAEVVNLRLSPPPLGAPQRREFEAPVEVAIDAGEARFEVKRRGSPTSEIDGFNVQAAVKIEGWDDEAPERLVRYCARPCFALERLSALRSGRGTYRVEHPTRGRRSQLSIDNASRATYVRHRIVRVDE
jgi:hypothetical protein